MLQIPREGGLNERCRLLISKDRTYQFTEYRIEVDEEPDFDLKVGIKAYVLKLLEKYEFLEGMECIKYYTEPSKNGKHFIYFRFWIDEIEILRDEQPHLFV